MGADPYIQNAYINVTQDTINYLNKGGLQFVVGEWSLAGVRLATESQADQHAYTCCTDPLVRSICAVMHSLIKNLVTILRLH